MSAPQMPPWLQEQIMKLLPMLHKEYVLSESIFVNDEKAETEKQINTLNSKPHTPEWYSKRPPSPRQSIT